MGYRISLDPVQLIAMQGLYNKALGFEMSQQQIAVLDALYTPPPPPKASTDLSALSMNLAGF